MIKLQDFARQQGVTDRAIQKHLKTYADELEGLFERRGVNGTWLSDEACEILRSKMKQQPVVISTSDERVERLEARIRELEGRLDEKDKLLTVSQQATQEAQNKVNLMLNEVEKVKALEDGNKALESKLKKTEDDKYLLQKELQAERNRKLTLRERLLGRKIGE